MNQPTTTTETNIARAARIEAEARAEVVRDEAAHRAHETHLRQEAQRDADIAVAREQCASALASFKARYRTSDDPERRVKRECAIAMAMFCQPTD